MFNASYNNYSILEDLARGMESTKSKNLMEYLLGKDYMNNDTTNNNNDWQPIRKDGELNLPKEFPVEVCIWNEKQGIVIKKYSTADRLLVSSWSIDDEERITHWKPLKLSAPPIPPPVEKTVAERVYAAWKKDDSQLTGNVKEAIQFTIDFLEKENKKV